MDNSPFSWSVTREAIRTRLGSEVSDRWIDPLSLVSSDAQGAVLEAPNVFFRDWIKSHYLDAIQEISGHTKITIVVGTGQSVATASRELASTPTSQSTQVAAKGKKPNTLNPKFAFDRFVIGPSNRFAHAASLAIAESPAKSYNPLFIYGGVGLGKTHLMQAVGHAILERWPERRVTYISSEEFTNELITAIQTRNTSKFRDRYRTVDVLLVDDIQFIAGKEATQEEFFHTFNTLYDAHKQIMLSSDRPPKEISGLEERLISRFEWGLVTDIQSPDLETRIAIVRKKAQEAGIEVPFDVTDFIGSQIRSNIRELEGALIRVIAYCNLFNEPLTLEIAQQVLKEMVREVGSRITVQNIQQCVADYFKIETHALKSTSRHRSILHPRQMAMFLSRRMTDASLPEIGQAFGGRDHTTVMHAVSKIEREITQDIHKKQLLDHLSQLVVTAAQRGIV